MDEKPYLSSGTPTPSESSEWLLEPAARKEIVLYASVGEDLPEDVREKVEFLIRAVFAEFESTALGKVRCTTYCKAGYCGQYSEVTRGAKPTATLARLSIEPDDPHKR